MLQNWPLIVQFHSLFLLFRIRSRVLKPGLIHLFFHSEQCFSLTNSSSIPPNHPDFSRIQTSEHALTMIEQFHIRKFKGRQVGSSQLRNCRFRIRHSLIKMRSLVYKQFCTKSTNFAVYIKSWPYSSRSLHG